MAKSFSRPVTDPNDFVNPLWLQLPSGKFLLTLPYLRGAIAVQRNSGYSNPYSPGPALAQYNYGYQNETSGQHDETQLPPLPTQLT